MRKEEGPWVIGAMTNPMENETVILKVAEFLEGDDLLRMRLSQAILATLSDPKHDFLWAKPCLELGVDSCLRPPWAEYQAQGVKWMGSRCFYATFLAWRGEFRGIECREVKKVKQWWTRMKEVLPLHVIASLNPPRKPRQAVGQRKRPLASLLALALAVPRWSEAKQWHKWLVRRTLCLRPHGLHFPFPHDGNEDERRQHGLGSGLCDHRALLLLRGNVGERRRNVGFTPKDLCVGYLWKRASAYDDLWPAAAVPPRPK